MAEEPSIEPDQEPSSDDSDMEESEEEPDQEPSYSSDSSYDTDDSIESEESDREESVSNTKEINVKRFAEALNSKRNRQMEEEEDRNQVYQEDLFDFPRDPENWREEDLMEYWADGPLKMTKPGWDPVWADEEDWEIVAEEVKAGRDPPIAPFYVPFRKYYPVIPDNDVDIATPKGVIEELDRIEEFLKWVSYIFPDGSSYEGTVWDDLAHGKGVYVAEQGFVRYEGEWLQNQMEGHGVVEVDIPGREPKPGSKLEAKMRAQGKIISRDFMSPEDREWLEMDIEDMYRSAGTKYEIPFDESEEWIRQFGQKPEKGRYRYAGQWKHGRMHGCGVYEVNERVIYGRFYFGELLDDITGCNADISGLHAGIAEVAAAKARMFVNKPDGMIREERGPYGDPQHPYLYEDNEVWTAPGFINQFYEVPDYWKGYVQDVDQEREMWLNSFYKAPLRLPMPAELEYWWSKEESPEFVLVNKEPEPDPEDPTKLIYTEDPLILHTRTGRLINYIEDEENGVRLFWQPHLKEGENVDPEKAVFLPLGYDEFYGKAVPVKKENKIERLISSVEQTLQSMLEKLAKWTEEQKKACELNLKLIEQELEFREAELSLQEALEDMEMELKEKQKEEEKRAAMEYKEEERRRSASAAQGDGDHEENEEEENAEETPWSFGSVSKDETEEQAKANKKENKSGKSSPFGTSSTSFASCSLALSGPSKLRESFLSWKKGPRPPSTEPFPCRCHGCFLDSSDLVNSVSFPQVFRRQTGIKAAQGSWRSRPKHNGFSQLHSLAVALSGDHGFSRPRTGWRRQRSGNSSKVKTTNREENWNFLSFQVTPYCLEC